MIKKIWTYFGNRHPVFYSALVTSRPFVHRSMKKKKHIFFEDAREKASKIFCGEELDKVLKDYSGAFDRHYVNWDEYYYEYRFPDLSECERNEFISVNEMRLVIRRIQKKEKEVLDNKILFMEKFGKYIIRPYLSVCQSTDDELVDKFISDGDTIAKPVSESCGRGIELIEKGTMSSTELKKRFLSSKGMLLERRISEIEGLRRFHPESLNTIRVVTFQNKGKCIVFGSFFRVGVGKNVVDNCHAGGLFAQIDVGTGKIVSDGVNTTGGSYHNHPTSKLPFKGFEIPYWKEIVALCKEAAMVIPEIHIVGWDVVVRENGQLELIEANELPDFDVMQIPLRKGVKKKVYSCLKELKLKQKRF